MAFFDVDEFLVLKKHATIDELLAQHLPRGALAISQHVFGAGSTRMYAPLPVTKRFVYRDGVGSHDRHRNWGLVKSIVKCADYGDYPSSPHSIKTNRRTVGSNKVWIDTNGKGTFYRQRQLRPAAGRRSYPPLQVPVAQGIPLEIMRSEDCGRQFQGVRRRQESLQRAGARRHGVAGAKEERASLCYVRSIRGFHVGRYREVLGNASGRHS